MAEGKESFLLYKDVVHLLDQMPDETAGKLFKIILDYVNDRNPVIEDLMLKIAFEPIKQALKRNLKKWEGVCEVRAKTGSKGGVKSGETRRLKAELKKQKEANEAIALKLKQTEANEAVSDIDSESDIVDDEKKKTSPSTTAVLFTIHDFEKEIIIGENEFSLLATRKTKRNLDQLKSFLTVFVSEQKALTKIIWQSSTDAKSHFINWVNKQPLQTITGYTPQITN